MTNIRFLCKCRRDAGQPAPLAGLTVLDVGCGGGILAEALARLGAHVTGADASAESIAVARTHAAGDPTLGVAYRAATAEQLVAEGAHGKCGTWTVPSMRTTADRHQCVC